MNVKKFNSVLLNKEKLTEDTYRFKFSIPEDFTFKAGQFVNIKCVDGEESKRRSYSILNPPSQKESLDICLRIISDGFASNVFSKAKEEDEFEITGPLGHFIFDEDDKNDEFWFLAAGTGVVPFYSILKEFVSKYPEKRFVLLFGVRKHENLLFQHEFKELENNHNNFEFRPVLSRESWDGLTGHVQDNLPENLDNKTFYICGLKELVLDTESVLTERGVEKERIKKERYS